jgi:methionyl aminopeptidase
MLFRRQAPRPKVAAELEKMRAAGRIVAGVLAHCVDLVAPGVTTGDLNEAAYEKGQELGAEDFSFLDYHGFPAVICSSVDEVVVHGIPGRCDYRGGKTADRTLEAGSLVSIDFGAISPGFHGDSAVTVPVGEVSPELSELLRVGREALWAGIRQVKPGSRLSDIARAIERSVRERPHRYGLVTNYVGHGIGRRLHEPPNVPNVLTKDLLRNDLVLEAGVTIAIEPMVCLGSARTKTLPDGWTVVTRDGQPAVHFEHSLAVTEDGFEILTSRSDGGTTH